MAAIGLGPHRDIVNKLLKTAHTWALLPVLLSLLIVIFAGTSGSLHAQLLKLGESIWDSYYLLRADLPAPSCDPDPDIEARLNELEASAETTAESSVSGVATGDDFSLDDLFEPEAFDRSAARVSLEAAKVICVERHQSAERTRDRITLGVRAFRLIETTTEYLSLFAYDQQRLLLLILLFVCACICTATHHHISFRPVVNQVDHWMSAGVSLIANIVFFFGSMAAYDQDLSQSGSVIQHPLTHQGVLIGIQVLCLANLLRLVALPEKIACVCVTRQVLLRSLLTIPLYTYMLVACGVYFFWAEQHPAGLSIYVGQLLEYANNFLSVGLFIWLGMLLKRTELGRLVFGVFAPWRFPPEVLTIVAVVVMALPTAFTGASGIIVIALGVVVYEELRRASTRRQLALATTALTGSSGVVLKPCLLVVIVAALNKEVVTEQLYSWGLKVFILSVLFFSVVVWLTRQGSHKQASLKEAWPNCAKALKALGPYLLILFVVVFAYYHLLGTPLDEFSAPIILPLVILAFIYYEKRARVKSGVESKSPELTNCSQETFAVTLSQATKETTVHVGALLMIMGLSFAVSGVIERSGLFELLPATFSSPWIAMTVMVVALVCIGMIMEPFGAVVMVSGTVAVLAYNSGIHPVHFWMVTLVAFELGYLTPPVALNHLLTRQVVGEQELALAAKEGHNFWYRHEKILMPMVVMGLTLLTVAYVPLIYTLLD